MREENGIIEIERAIDKLSRHHIRHIKVCIRHIKVCIRHIKVCLKASYKAYQGTFTNPVCVITTLHKYVHISINYNSCI